PLAATDQSSWREVIPYDHGMYLEQVYPFADCLLLSGRQEGLSQLWTYRGEALEKLDWAESVYTVEVGENRMYTTTEAMVVYESLLTPRTFYEIDLGTLQRRLVHKDEVPGEYNPADYRQERLWATAADGTRVPMSLVSRVGAFDLGPAPLILR
ncbi:protein containing Peptidase S9A, oligopeptidase, partial [mine drainage metagenome]